MKTKYIYSAYGQEFKENMKFLDDYGLNDKICELAEISRKLVKDENFDRAQLETYICSHFKFEVMHKILNNATDVEKNTKETKDDGK